MEQNISLALSSLGDFSRFASALQRNNVVTLHDLVTRVDADLRRTRPAGHPSWVKFEFVWGVGGGTRASVVAALEKLGLHLEMTEDELHAWTQQNEGKA